MISIELFFLVNAALNAWLMTLALKWLDAGRPGFKRVALSASLGGIYACAAWMNASLPLRGAAVSLPVALLMSRIAGGSQRLSVTLKTAGFFLAAAALNAGAAYALTAMIPGLYPTLAAALACAASGAAAQAFVGSRRRARLTYGRIRMRFRSAQWSFDAAVDTGNQAIDPVSGLPVVVMRREEAAKRFPSLDEDALPEGMRLIPVRTVSGTALLPCFTPEAITWNEQPIQAAVAVAPRGLITVALAPSCLAETNGSAPARGGRSRLWPSRASESSGTARRSDTTRRTPA
ncbi:MAG: sigma-E processing peptidase SpoIIGA [Oscillospiraceae bacterium]|jgi:hypothetical protein|nr:sigma-E processing peptidase SpoIIGA [Oscillospiraceae bacterium]